METQLIRDGEGGRKKKTSMARGGFQCSITRQLSSREADEDTTVCLSCQHWGELGICQLYIPSPIQARRPRQSATQTASHPSLNPHSLLCTLGEQVAAYGDISAGSFDRCEPSRIELFLFCSSASSAILMCAADAVQLQHNQTWTLRSRSNAGVTEAPVSRLESLSLALWGLFSFKYLCHYRAFTCTCFGAEGAIKSQFVKKKKKKTHIYIICHSKS